MDLLIFMEFPSLTYEDNVISIYIKMVQFYNKGLMGALFNHSQIMNAFISAPFEAPNQN
jgi:hypothetical protein